MEKVGQIFRGFTGRPVFLERQQGHYRNELEQIVAAWMVELEGRGPEELAGMLLVLEVRLQNAAERHIPKAYELGIDGRALDEDDQRNIDTALASNRVFLQTSLIPAIANRIHLAMEGVIDEALPTFGQAVGDSLPFSQNRTGLYAGLFWTMIWVASSAALKKRFGPQGTTQVKVRRLLDPKSKHCGTCPGKAGEYQSFDEMLSLTGGLPADGSDQCHSNCNCTLQFFIEGNWTGVV